MKRFPLPSVAGAACLIAVLVIYMISFTVRFSETALRIKFGRVEAVESTPGWYFKQPWPFETIQKYETRLHTLDTVESEIKTRDGKNIIIGNYAFWRIADPQKFHVAVATVPRAEELLRARINQRRAAVIGNETLSAFVNPNEDLIAESYARVERNMLTEPPSPGEPSLQQAVKQDFGIELVKVDMRRISLPEETTQSVFAQMSAERQREAARFREEGKSRAQTITSQAESARDQILAFANKKAEEIRATGVAASINILTQIEAEDVEFFEWLRWLDALKVALKERSTIFLDSRSELFRFFDAPQLPAGEDAPRQPALEIPRLPGAPLEAAPGQP